MNIWTDELVRYVVAHPLTAQARTDSQTGGRLWMIHDVETDADSPKT